MDDSLIKRISELEAENKYLRDILAKAGIEYQYPPRVIGTPIELGKLNRKNVQYFFSYFWGRTDVYSKRYIRKNDGKAGYFTQCNNFWKSGICPKSSGEKIQCRNCSNKSWKKLNPEIVLNHLLGSKDDESDVIGIYPLFPDNTCRFLVFDFDNHNELNKTNNQAFEEANIIRSICVKYKFPCLVERSRSGNGAHVWLFFESPIQAGTARKFGDVLLNKGKEFADIKSFDYYDRMIPSQDILDKDGLGNLIALPLQGKALKNGNSAFIDEKQNAYSNQWEVLLSTRKIPSDEINKFIEDDGIANDSYSPWEGMECFSAESVEGRINIVLANGIYINKANLSNKLRNQIRRLAAYKNPKFYRNKGIGLSNYNEPRFIYLGEDVGDYIHIPIGLLDQLLLDFDVSGIEYDITDKRSEGQVIDAEFKGQLRDNQEVAVNKLLQSNTGILHAATAFGKTVVCANIITRRKTNTLIVLEKTSLIDQWQESLLKFIDFKDAVPTYVTQSGKIKSNKTHIGIIHGIKDTSGGIVDIAMAGSLFKNGKPHHRLKEYGMIIVDECHHSATNTLRRVLEECPAKYVLGVTATVARGDGHEKTNLMLLGPVRHRFTAKEKTNNQSFAHYVIPRFTSVVFPHGHEKLTINQAYKVLLNNQMRNDLIVNDIRDCIDRKRTVVVLTKFKEHADYLYSRVKDEYENAYLLTGDISKKTQCEIREQLNSAPIDSAVVLIATGQLIGEGFDFPRLDTLIIGMPIAWKGLVEQYVGRLNRDYSNKSEVFVYDYIDSHIPLFDNMYQKRLRAYKQIGYELYLQSIDTTESDNHIFDVDSYSSVFYNDIVNAKESVIISSPLLSRKKVIKMISLLKNAQERGVKVTVLTLRSEAYWFGKDENRYEIYELLHNSGINVRLTDERAERYTVIDNEVVWYGSIHLLFKDDVEDNIMRLKDKEIATELLLANFGKDSIDETYDGLSVTDIE